MNMENLTAKFSHQTRLTNSRGFYLRVTEDNVEGVEDENDKYSEYVTKFCTVQSSSGFGTCRHLIKIDYILRQTVISKVTLLLLNPSQSEGQRPSSRRGFVKKSDRTKIVSG